jgi:hypothetical protein
MCERDYQNALDLIRGGDPAVVSAFWENFSSPYEIDVEGTVAVLQPFKAVVQAALKDGNRQR